MQQRILGRTGRNLSVLGFGGLVVRDVTTDEAARFVGQAVDRGINYFDVAPSYGNAEQMLGPALRPYRDDVFLACKTGHRDAAEALAELHQSLDRLETDHVDLYQCHAVSSVEQAERILAPGGALEAFIDARRQGLIRHIGFSAHNEEAALHLLDAFEFDTVMLPINLFCWRDGGFGPRVCEKAGKRGTAVLALKALARRPLREGEQKKWPKCWYVPIDNLEDAKAAISFTLSRPVTAAVCPSHAELLWLACDAVDQLEAAQWPQLDQTAVEGQPIFPK